MEKETPKYYKHLLAHLPIVKDPTLVILRGHLLLEELLDEVLKAWLKDPSVLSDTRLTFHQKMKLSKGIISGGRDGFTWKPVDLLNQLRNRISHRLSPHDLELKIDEFLKCVYPEDYRDIPSDIYSKSKAMRKAIIFHCAYLSGMIENLKLMKEKQFEPLTSSERNRKNLI
jgi:hypothetical protein